MKNTSVFSMLSFAIILVFAFTNCTSPATVEPEDITAEIQALNKEFRAAFKSGDASAVAARYTEDGKLYPPNSDMLEGQSAVAAYWQGAMDAGLTDADISTQKATAYGDMAIEVGTVDIFAGEGQLVDKAKFMVTWKKVDGQWKMYEDIWNSSMPAPAPPPAEEASEDME